MRFIGDEKALSPRRFALIVGNGRSGTTLMGSIVDAHPAMVCANETNASQRFWRGCDRAEIVREIIDNALANAATGRPSYEYLYAISTGDKNWRDIAVVADKVWNPSLLLMHGDRSLIASLADRVGCPVSLVHCTRHPLDVIATMHRRSGASLYDRMRWYFMHCEAAQALAERGDAPLEHFAHERMVAAPGNEIARVCEFLGVPQPDGYADACRRVIFAEPKRTRDSVSWPPALVSEIAQRAQQYPFLRAYEFGD